MTSRHWLRTPSDEDPEPYSDDECRYCEECRRENAQVVEINEALHDALGTLVQALKTDGGIISKAAVKAIADAEIILGTKL